MKCNIENADKAIRVMLALFIGALGFYIQSWWGLLVIVSLVTGIVSFGPLYTILNFNTYSAKGVQ